MLELFIILSYGTIGIVISGAYYQINKLKDRNLEGTILLLLFFWPIFLLFWLGQLIAYFWD